MGLGQGWVGDAGNLAVWVLEELHDRTAAAGRLGECAPSPLNAPQEGPAIGDRADGPDILGPLS